MKSVKLPNDMRIRVLKAKTNQSSHVTLLVVNKVISQSRKSQQQDRQNLLRVNLKQQADA
jgi:hypothetical protein